MGLAVPWLCDKLLDWVVAICRLRLPCKHSERLKTCEKAAAGINDVEVLRFTSESVRACSFKPASVRKNGYSVTRWELHLQHKQEPQLQTKALSSIIEHLAISPVGVCCAARLEENNAILATCQKCPTEV